MGASCCAYSLVDCWCWRLRKAFGVREEEGPGQSSARLTGHQGQGGLLVRRRVAVAGPPLWAGARQGAGRAVPTEGQHRPLKAPPPQRVPESPCPCGCPVPGPGQPGPSQLPMNRLPGGVAGNTRTFPFPRGALFSWPRVITQVLSACLPAGGGPQLSPPPSLSFYFWLGHMACGIFIPRPGFESAPPAQWRPIVLTP